jgi:Family of unknown function (DUF6174)
MKTHLVGLILVAVFLIGCGGFDEDPRQQALYQLSVNRMKWDNKHLHDYSFDYDLEANIAPHPLRIDVRADTVNRVTDRESGAVYANAGNPTVDSLFARVSRLIASPGEGIRVQYNAALGFPESITAASSIPDTGYTITVSNLVTP